MDDTPYVPPTGPNNAPPPSREIYARMGEANIFRMMADFYAELGNSSIRAMFPEDLGASSERSAAFFVGLLGGPPLYQQRYGAPMMRARHLPFPIDESARQAWLDCWEPVLARATSDYNFPAAHLEGFRAFLVGFSGWMVNRRTSGRKPGRPVHARMDPTHMDIYILNRFSYIILATLVLVAMGLFFARSGFTRARALALGVAALAFFTAWATLRTGAGTTTDAQAANLVLRESEQPVLIEFYSDYCAGCLAARPMVDSLERELGDRLRVVRLNVGSPAGKDLAIRLQADQATPAFVLLDPDGQELWRGFGFFDDAAVRTALDSSS